MLNRKEFLLSLLAVPLAWLGIKKAVAEPIASGGINSSSLESTRLVALEALKALAEINSDYSSEFGRSGAKIGDTIAIRKPQRFHQYTSEDYWGGPSRLTASERCFNPARLPA